MNQTKFLNKYNELDSEWHVVIQDTLQRNYMTDMMIDDDDDNVFHLHHVLLNLFYLNTNDFSND